MSARPILQLGNPLLRCVSGPTGPVEGVRGVLQDLRDTLHCFQQTHGFGRGISAIQIGEPKRLIYLEFEGRAYCLHDPEYQYLGEERFRLWDDCFSFPGLLVWLERHMAVGVKYRDENGDARVLEASGALSELLQHEMDHLDGILAVDRAIGRNGLCTREEYERRYAATRAAPPASE